MIDMFDLADALEAKFCPEGYDEPSTEVIVRPAARSGAGGVLDCRARAYHDGVPYQTARLFARMQVDTMSMNAVQLAEHITVDWHHDFARRRLKETER